MKTQRKVYHREMVVRRVRTRSSEAAAARFEARRVRREQPPLLTRQRLRMGVTSVAAGALLFCVTAVYRSPLFVVRDVRVSGLSSLMPDEAAHVEAASQPPPHSNLFSVSRGRLEAAIKHVPAVEEAKVARRFPRGLDVAVTARTPIAVLATGSDRWEVDRSGVAIRSARPDEKLPEIACATAIAVAAGQRIDVPGLPGALSAAMLTARGKPLGIAKIEVDQIGDLCLNMVDTVAIRIGQTDQLDTKLALVRRIYVERPDIGTEVESIDLRFPEAPACLPRGAAGRDRRASSSATASPSAAQPLDLAGGPRKLENADHLGRPLGEEPDPDTAASGSPHRRGRHRGRTGDETRSGGEAGAADSRR